MTVHTDATAQAHAHDQINVPRPIIYGMIALCLFALVSIGTGRALGIGVTHEGTLSPVRQVSFTFSDPAHAAIVATRSDGTHVTLAGDGQEIFPRLILRSVVNHRQREGVAPTRPIDLIQTKDGQRLLVDKAAHDVIRLAAFGPENDESFDALFGKPA